MPHPHRRARPLRRIAVLGVLVVAVLYGALVAWVSQAIVAPPRVRIADTARPVLGLIVAGSPEGGVEIRRAVAPAGEAGLAPGDRLLVIEGRGIERPEDVVAAVAGRADGELLRVHARRIDSQGNPVEVWVDVGVDVRALSPADVGLPYEDVAFTDPEGRILRGWYVPPPDPSLPSPGVIHAHGNGGDRRQGLFAAWDVHRAGFAQLLFDFAGRGESEGDTITLGPREADGLRGAMDAMASRPEVDGARLALVGRSMGAVAAILAGRDPRVRALVLDSPFATLEDVVDHNLRARGVPPALVRGPAFAVVAVRARFEPGDVRPVDVIADVDVPILLMHGEDDDLVPIRHAERLAEAAGDRATLVRWPGIGHNDPRPEDLGRSIAAFLRRSVP